MTTTSVQFDLNAALHHWREQLQQSAHFRTENLDELEAHLRDSVNVLQTKGLTADEAFMIGTRRVGTPEALEDQFAAENGGRGFWNSFRRIAHHYKSRALHLLILAYFTFGCWLLWGCLKVSQMMEPAAARASHVAGVEYGGAPAFNRLCWNLMPYWYFLPALATVYCGIIWTRKNSKASWSGFFCFTTAVLFLFLVPILIASELPIISFLHSLPPRIFEAQH